MELVNDFGDPDALILSDNHIVLKLETALPQSVKVPDGVTVGGDDRLLLVTNKESLISASKSALVRRAKISKALFCACESFSSSSPYRRAARKLLRYVQEVCIVHNRDTVHTLLDIFPCARTIALPHDMALHMYSLDPSAMPIERCQLRQLVGSTANRDVPDLIMSWNVTMALIRSCPDVCRIDSQFVVDCFMRPHPSLTPADLERAKNFTHILIVDADVQLDTEEDHSQGAADVALAAQTFPSVDSLQALVESQDWFTKISAFRGLRSLAVTFTRDLDDRDIGHQLEELLAKLPALEKLHLETCGGLRLALISTLCVGLKSLSLTHCSEPLTDVPEIPHDAFPNLECVELRMCISGSSLFALLNATKNKLRIARFLLPMLCTMFLDYCISIGRTFPFLKLERLTLDTQEKLSEMQIQLEDLRDVFKALPALQHVETDSFELRLFFENDCIPRGRLSLSWVGCVYCAAHGRDQRKEIDDFTEAWRVLKDLTGSAG
ncbi:hypothetical protein HPB50_010218 [Hyalomma asiaticum]|uniref:Uncharacterized protein n=1 Tax=Hyalomma asiaticum TaxID=266040 RepID=A0ACB7RQM8_HYAAI|nr:hypothetical protein HPB50_010218 [Hyalomma asiaticum]